MSNKGAKQGLKLFYGKWCFLTGYKLKPNTCTYHHLEKKELGGQATIDNGALLHDSIHKYLHKIELQDKALFDLINEVIDLYKTCMDQGQEHLIEQYEEEVMPEFRKKMTR